MKTRSIMSVMIPVLSVVFHSHGALLLKHAGGEANKAVVGSIAAGGVAAGTAAKLGIFKGGASEAAKVLATKGSVSVATKGAVGTFAAHEGVVLVAENEATVLLENTTAAALKSHPSLLTKDEMPELFIKYPRLGVSLQNEESYNEFLARNPRFLNDASISLYRRNPQLFAKQFLEQPVLRNFPSSFGKVIHQQISEEHAKTVEELVDRVTTVLEQKGFTPLQDMEEHALDRLVDKVLSREVDKLLKETGVQWSYKSGTLTVQGEVGHFSFEQEVSLRGVVKTFAVGAAAASGYKVVWKKDSFVQIHSCIDSFCIDADSKHKQLVIDNDREKSQSSDEMPANF